MRFMILLLPFLLLSGCTYQPRNLPPPKDPRGLSGHIYDSAREGFDQEECRACRTCCRP